MQSGGPKGGELTPIARGPEGQRARANVFLPNPRARDDSQDAQFARLQSMLGDEDAEKPKGKPKAEQPAEEDEEHSEEDSLLQRGWSSASTGEPEHPCARPPPTAPGAPRKNVPLIFLCGAGTAARRCASRASRRRPS